MSCRSWPGGTDGAWGVGFLTWAIKASAVEHALSYRPRAVMLSFGDPAPYTELIRGAGAALIIQVTDLDEARQALDAGADVIVAQGTEAGGHGGERGRSTMSFVPVVADLAAPTPVLAAGGIADGRGIAAALCLGAAGALIGTRFFATPETLADPAVTKAIVDGHGEDTARNRVHDILRGSPWPSRYPGRSLRDPFLDEWQGREERAGRGPRRPAGLPGRDRPRRGDAGAGLGQPGHRPDHRAGPGRGPGRPAGRPGHRSPGRRGRGRLVTHHGHETRRTGHDHGHDHQTTHGLMIMTMTMATGMITTTADPLPSPGCGTWSGRIPMTPPTRSTRSSRAAPRACGRCGSRWACSA